MTNELVPKKPYLFQKGVSGNPGGRPKVNSEYRDALIKTVKMEDWVQIVTKRGDKYAREWLTERILGKPVQHTEFVSDNIMRFTVEYGGLPDKTTDSAS